MLSSTKIAECVVWAVYEFLRVVECSIVLTRLLIPMFDVMDPFEHKSTRKINIGALYSKSY